MWPLLRVQWNCLRIVLNWLPRSFVLRSFALPALANWITCAIIIIIIVCIQIYKRRHIEVLSFTIGGCGLIQMTIMLFYWRVAAEELYRLPTTNNSDSVRVTNSQSVTWMVRNLMLESVSFVYFLDPIPLSTLSLIIIVFTFSSNTNTHTKGIKSIDRWW